MAHQTYMAISPTPVIQQHIQNVETTALLMSEVSGPGQKYVFDGSVCGGSETDEAVFRDDTVFVARRFGCCCCSTSESSVVKSREILSADISTTNSFGTIFLGWILFGCLGHHRFCGGRRTSGIVMFICFTLSLAFTVAGYIQADEYGRCGNGWCTYTNNAWLATGIVASVVLALTILWWFYDVFLLRHWAHTKVDLKTSHGGSTTFRISQHQAEAFRADLEAQYRVR